LINACWHLSCDIGLDLGERSFAAVHAIGAVAAEIVVAVMSVYRSPTSSLFGSVIYGVVDVKQMAEAANGEDQGKKDHHDEGIFDEGGATLVSGAMRRTAHG